MEKEHIESQANMAGKEAAIRLDESRRQGSANDTNSFLLEKYLATLATKEDVAKLRADNAETRAKVDTMQGEVRGLREIFENLRQDLKKEIHLTIYRTAGAIIVAGVIFGLAFDAFLNLKPNN